MMPEDYEWWFHETNGWKDSHWVKCCWCDWESDHVDDLSDEAHRVLVGQWCRHFLDTHETDKPDDVAEIQAAQDVLRGGDAPGVEEVAQLA